jgi:hypothetical protein
MGFGLPVVLSTKIRDDLLTKEVEKSAFLPKKPA